MVREWIVFIVVEEKLVKDKLTCEKWTLVSVCFSDLCNGLDNGTLNIVLLLVREVIWLGLGCSLMAEHFAESLYQLSKAEV